MRAAQLPLHLELCGERRGGCASLAHAHRMAAMVEAVVFRGAQGRVSARPRPRPRQQACCLDVTCKVFSESLHKQRLEGTVREALWTMS